MSRYIDADALKEWLDEYLSVFKKYDKGTIKGFVDHAPSIDIEPKRGEWINKHEWSNGFFERECSVCGAMKPQLMHTAKINFCPNCGARMKGADDE